MDLQDIVLSRKRDIQEEVLSWARANLRNFPWRKQRTPFRVLIAELLLRRTTAKAVLRIYEELLNTYPDIDSLAKAEESKLRTILKSCGFQNTRVPMLIKMAQFIMRKHNGKIPNSKQDLIQIPLVGNYTANAVLTLGFDIPAAMVDSNVERVIRRLFSRHLDPKIKLIKIKEVANLLLSKSDSPLYNLGLIDIGSLICRHDVLRCKDCPLKPMCDTFS